MENEDNSEGSFLKRSAFNQYFAISQEMTSFEKELFSKFLHEGTFTVNNVLKRNILKLKFLSLPQDLRDELINKESSSPQVAQRIKGTRLKQKPRQSGVLKTLTAKKDTSVKTKFSVMSTAFQWIVSRPGSDNADLALAEKLVKASGSSVSVKSSRTVKSDYKMSQAKCKICSNKPLMHQSFFVFCCFIKHLPPFSLFSFFSNPIKT